MVSKQSPRARMGMALVLVCIVGVVGAWNVLFSAYNAARQGPTAVSVEHHQHKESESKPKAEDASHDKNLTRSNDTLTQESFPVTRFTPHVMQVVEMFDFSQQENLCDIHILVEVPRANAVPTVNCTKITVRGNGIINWWCTVLNNILQERTLPYNVSFAVSAQDYLWRREKNNACLGSSSEGGDFTITNFLEIKRMFENIHYNSLAWDKRKQTPIFRGTPWVNESLYKKVDRTNESAIYQQVLDISPRLKAVDFSLRHPKLLNARVHRDPNVDTQNDTIWWKNSTVGLRRLLTNDFIKSYLYYRNYQSALVLCGIGASFRTSIHLETSTAVILQECDKKEWFTPLMTPFEHYIPIQHNLQDLGTKLKWIQNHPVKVRRIAENGRQFYQDYLSFDRNEEHIYEFVYRLAVAKAQYDDKIVDSKRGLGDASDEEQLPLGMKVA